jgi:hypothetical protein
VRKVGPLLGEIALDFEWSAVQASDWPATYFLGHRGLDLRNYAPALLWPGVNDDPGAALPVSVARRPAGPPPAAALTAIHVPLEEGRRPVGARRRFPIELLWLFSLFPRPLGLLYRLSGRCRVTLPWQPWSRTSVLVRTALLAG